MFYLMEGGGAASGYIVPRASDGNVDGQDS